MRRSTIVAGVTVGALGLVGTGAASAASLPIGITFTTGVATAGSLDAAEAATPSAPASLQGTIDTTTLNATFPKASINFPDAPVRTQADFGALGKGDVTISAAAASDFTGKPNPTTASLDLSGSVTYKFTVKLASTTYTCVTGTPAGAMGVPVTLTGKSLSLASGAYAVGGSATITTVASPLVGGTPNPVEAAFCSTMLQSKVLPSTLLSYAGNLAVQGLIPTGTGTTNPGTGTGTGTGTGSGTGGSTSTKKAKLSVAITRPKRVARGKSTLAKVRVRNAGKGTAKSVTVKLSAAKGLSPRSTSKRFSSIASGKTRTFSVRLKSTKSAPTSSTLKVTAKGSGGLSASKSTTLRLR